MNNPKIMHGYLLEPRKTPTTFKERYQERLRKMHKSQTLKYSARNEEAKEQTQ